MKRGNSMNDKYIEHYICKTKKKMDLYIEEQLKANGLTDVVPSYRNVLTVLFDHGGKLSMKAIGDLIGKDKSTVTALVNKLIKLGYVKKEKCTEDRRKTYIILRRKSKDIQDRFDTISKDVYSRAYDNFSLEEKETFLTLLKKLNNNFDR